MAGALAVKFKIRGRHRESGRQLEVPIFAANRDEAVRMAEAQGLDVLSVKVRVKSFGPNFERAGWIISGIVTVLMLLAMVFLAMFLRQPSATATVTTPPPGAKPRIAPSALTMPSFQPLDHLIEETAGRKVVKSWLLVHGTPTRAQLDALMMAQFNEIRSRPYYIVNDTQNDIWIWAYGSQQDFDAKRNCLARLRKPFDIINPTIEYLPGTADAVQTEVEVEPLKEE